MIGNLLSNKDFTRYFVYATIFAVAFNRAYGLSNLLRFALRYFGVGYTDSKMKNLDNRWFDIQLFKIINGINSSNINDIRLIQRGLNEGQLKPSSFFLTSSWGDIMRAPPAKKRTISILIGLALIGLGSFFWCTQTTIPDGFAKVNFYTHTFYLSKETLIITPLDGDFKNTNIYSKEDCINSRKLLPNDTIFASACNMMMDDSQSYQRWLREQITTNEKSKNTLLILAYLYCTIGLVWLFSFKQFIRANSQVLKYKEFIEKQNEGVGNKNEQP